MVDFFYLKTLWKMQFFIRKNLHVTSTTRWDFPQILPLTSSKEGDGSNIPSILLIMLATERHRSYRTFSIKTTLWPALVSKRWNGFQFQASKLPALEFRSLYAWLSPHQTPRSWPILVIRYSTPFNYHHLRVWRRLPRFNDLSSLKIIPAVYRIKFNYLIISASTRRLVNKPRIKKSFF